jgi:chromatin structure-remodeling complex subunit RSC1/2
MSSQPPDPPASTAEANPEDTPMAESDALGEAEAEAALATSTEFGLGKKDFETMTGILHRLTNYKDQEYGKYLGF